MIGLNVLFLSLLLPVLFSFRSLVVDWTDIPLSVPTNRERIYHPSSRRDRINRSVSLCILHFYVDHSTERSHSLISTLTLFSLPSVYSTASLLAPLTDSFSSSEFLSSSISPILSSRFYDFLSRLR